MIGVKTEQMINGNWNIRNIFAFNWDICYVLCDHIVKKKIVCIKMSEFPLYLFSSWIKSHRTFLEDKKN